MTEVTGRMVAQRARNNLIDVLDTVASLEAQLAYQREVDWINVPRELLAQFDDWFPENDQWRSVYTVDEIRSVESAMVRREAVGDAIGSGFPDVHAVQSMAEWISFAESVREALAALRLRGRLPEDHEVS